MMKVRQAVLGSLVLAALAGLAGWMFGWPGQSRPPEQIFEDGYAALEEGDVPGVQTAINALQAHPGYEEHAQLLRGALYARGKNFGGALQIFSRLTPDGDLRQPLYLLTGECLYYSGRLAEAERLFRTLVVEEPELADAHRWLGAIYYDLGALDQALPALRDLSRLQPDDYRPHHLMGQIYFDFEQYPSAIEQYRQALEKDAPADLRPELVESLGRALIHQREFETALEVLRTSTVSDTTNLALQSQCHWSLGNKDEARELLSRAQTQGARNRTTDLLAARIHLDVDEIDEATQLLRALLEEDRHDFEARYQLALAYRQQNQMERYEKEMEMMQESRDLHLRISELNHEAISRPNDADVRDQLAQLYQQLGKAELAQMWKQAAENCRPNQESK